MNISILTVFPELYHSFLSTSLIGRAQEQKKISFDVTGFFSLVEPKERIDAPTFGHGSGLLIKPDIIAQGIEQQEQKFGKAFKIFFSPQGKKLDQTILQNLAQRLEQTQHLLLVASRYEGMDERVEQEYADLVLSIGDYVLMGGDLPAMVFLESFLRLTPGIVGKQESVEHESFTGPFVDHPEYTHPVIWHGKEVPEVLRSGNHAAIKSWRQKKSIQKTVISHFSWLRTKKINQAEKKIITQVMPPHYCALMHTQVLLPHDLVGTTSVTSIDIHDIARSSKTYGLKGYFIVTPLIDQQRIVKTLLDFWQTGTGIDYNPQRHQALQSVTLTNNLTEVIENIERLEGVRPLIIATSARDEPELKTISYFDQEKVWSQNRPVLLVFGTGKGLSYDLLEQCDYLLLPITGFSEYNHLSVRSAAAIIFDRWLGINLTTG